MTAMIYAHIACGWPHDLCHCGRRPAAELSVPVTCAFCLGPHTPGHDCNERRAAQAALVELGREPTVAQVLHDTDSGSQAIAAMAAHLATLPEQAQTYTTTGNAASAQAGEAGGDEA